MKKICLCFLSLFLLTFTLVFADEIIPEFSNSNAFCFDSTQLNAETGDGFFVRNETTKNLEIAIYKYETKKADYKLAKKAVVKAEDCKSFISDVGDEKYYAIELENVNSYDFWIYVVNEQLYVNIFEKTPDGLKKENQLKKEHVGFMIESLSRSNDYKLIEASIKDYIPLLTKAERKALYEEYERSPVAPFLLNLLVGFGVGSYSIHDNKTGTLQLVTSCVGVLFASVFGPLMLNEYFERVNNYNKEYEEYEKNKKNGYNYWSEPEEPDVSELFGAYAFIGIGAFIMQAGAIPGYIRPWTYTRDYNRKIYRALGLEEDSSYSMIEPIKQSGENFALTFAPIINPVNKDFGLMAQINF